MPPTPSGTVLVTARTTPLIATAAESAPPPPEEPPLSMTPDMSAGTSRLSGSTTAKRSASASLTVSSFEWSAWRSSTGRPTSGQKIGPPKSRRVSLPVPNCATLFATVSRSPDKSSGGLKCASMVAPGTTKNGSVYTVDAILWPARRPRTQQRLPVDREGQAHAKHVGDCRQHVDVLHRTIVDDSRGRSRKLHEQRHAQHIRPVRGWSAPSGCRRCESCSRDPPTRSPGSCRRCRPLSAC